MTPAQTAPDVSPGASGDCPARSALCTIIEMWPSFHAALARLRHARMPDAVKDGPLAWTDGRTILYHPNLEAMEGQVSVDIALRAVCHCFLRHPSRAARMAEEGRAFSPALLALAAEAATEHRCRRWHWGHSRKFRPMAMPEDLLGRKTAGTAPTTLEGLYAAVRGATSHAAREALQKRHSPVSVAIATQLLPTADPLVNEAGLAEIESAPRRPRPVELSAHARAAASAVLSTPWAESSDLLRRLHLDRTSAAVLLGAVLPDLPTETRAPRVRAALGTVTTADTFALASGIASFPDLEEALSAAAVFTELEGLQDGLMGAEARVMASETIFEEAEKRNALHHVAQSAAYDRFVAFRSAVRGAKAGAEA